jgi:DNA-binding MarR family transcriptional regulator
MGSLDAFSNGAVPCDAPIEIHGTESDKRPVSLPAYHQLAEFRFQIRSFLHFSENAVRQAGIEPQQHQLMLAIKGLPQDHRPTVTALAHRLCLKHHSTVELINRLERRGAVVRTPSEHDRREVLIQLTQHGEELLEKLSVLHWRELQAMAPGLSAALDTILNNSPEKLQKSV